MRAITHVVGKAIRSSRRARRGAGWWLRTTMAPRAGAENRAAGGVAAGVGGPSSSHRRACPDGRPGGGGVRSAMLRTIKRRSTAAAGLRSLSPAVGGRRHAPGRALACRPLRSCRRLRNARLLIARKRRGRPAMAICRSRISFVEIPASTLVAVLALDCPDTSHIVSVRAGMECPPGDRYVTFEVASYCGLIPAASMIRAALSFSRSTNRVNSGCVMLIGSPPCFTSQARTPGSDRARAMSAASV